MQSQPNVSFGFALALMSRLTQAQIMTWLCGGWAEELYTSIAQYLGGEDVEILDI